MPKFNETTYLSPTLSVNLDGIEMDLNMFIENTDVVSLYSYGHLSVISTNKTPFIECIIP